MFFFWGGGGVKKGCIGNKWVYENFVNKWVYEKFVHIQNHGINSTSTLKAALGDLIYDGLFEFFKKVSTF